MDRGPWTTRWTWSMDHPMDSATPWTTPNFQKEIAPVNRKIYRKSGYEKHILIFIACVLEGLSCNGAGASYVIRQPTPSKAMLRLIRKLNTLCAPPLKLQAIH